MRLVSAVVRVLLSSCKRSSAFLALENLTQPRSVPWTRSNVLAVGQVRRTDTLLYLRRSNRRRADDDSALTCCLKRSRPRLCMVDHALIAFSVGTARPSALRIVSLTETQLGNPLVAD